MGEFDQNVPNGIQELLPELHHGQRERVPFSEIGEAMLSTLLDTVEEAVTIVDANGIVRYWNSVAQRLYGILERDIIGKPIGEFPWKSLILGRVLKEGIAVHQLYHEPRPLVHVLINATPIRIQGKIVGAIATEQDVTSLVRLGDELMNTNRQLASLEETVQRQNDEADPFESILGNGRAITQAIHIAKRVAKSDAAVLLYGESGTGKELFAHAIHRASQQSNGPFIAVNCGAIPQGLFESELFGYQPGTFTGADRKGKIGKLELAQKGTIFLDEIGELPLELQVKLLRVLEDRMLYRIGSERGISLDVRILSATNRDLQEEVMRGRFRADLYYRLNVVSLDLPPLREHMEDIPLLVQRFAHQFAMQYNRLIPNFDPDVMLALVRYSWPGNVRQLKNMVERLVILADEDGIHVHHLPPEIQQVVFSGSEHRGWQEDLYRTREASQFLEQSESSIPLLSKHSTNTFPREEEKEGGKRNKRITPESLRNTLLRTYGNKAAAARELGISRATLYNYLRTYRMSD
ncbi:sigma-54 interaction domain-containing protein [Sulfoacidibacillus thermotolerans]|uniref:Sigma-54-dependent Fis family transcriptional regulator n=1 Tax=Sulfoacidibacillus thermotolerans TaxID=1765684 RepID=A0A2U3DBR1_SULT2|nr:sigma 54-interacting transcriptional regulator [Sulfoacidibacillus thermotolerans]PWI58717.1 hypothetical protein BM613_01055 [Sulfoacidibacillus thermotolerans]